MIMLKLKNADQETKIDFPCLHEHIRYRLEEIGLDGANAPKVLVREVEAPRALSFLEGLEVNVDEINYLANEIESLEEIQAEKLYAIIAYKGYKEPKDLINAKFNLDCYTLISGPDVDVNFDTSGTKKASIRPVFMTTRKTTLTVTTKKSAVYTRENTDQATYFTFQPETSFVDAVSKAGLNTSEIKSYEGTGTALTITNFFDKSYLNAISGSENAKKNKLIDAIDGYGSQNPA